MILGVNFAAGNLGVSLRDSSGRHFCVESCDTFGSAELVDEHVELLLSRAGMDWSGLQGVITLLGPGSYTGLRIGLSFSKTLAQTLLIPLYCESALMACVFPFVSQNGVYLSVIPGRKHEVNAQLFRITNKDILALSDPFVISVDRLISVCEKLGKEAIIVGDLPNECLVPLCQLDRQSLLPDLLSASSLTRAYFDGVLGTPVHDVLGQKPIYFHDPV